MDALYAIDVRVFEALNSGAANPLVDALTRPFAYKSVLLMLVAVAMCAAFILGGKELKWTLISAAAAFIASDALVYVLKHLVGRVRPCQALSGVRLLIDCPESFSFPSRHTAAAFAVASVLALNFGKYSPAFILPAVFTGFSRIYSGAHYPSDVLCGAVIGIAAGAAAYFICGRRGRRLMDALKRRLAFRSTGGSRS